MPSLLYISLFSRVKYRQLMIGRVSYDRLGFLLRIQDYTSQNLWGYWGQALAFAQSFADNRKKAVSCENNRRFLIGKTRVVLMLSSGRKRVGGSKSTLKEPCMNRPL